MSDTTTTTSTAPAAAPAAAQSASSTPQASAPAGSKGANAGAQGGHRSPGEPASQATGETQAEAQARILSEQDLDAFIEHRVNGRVERVKVRDLQKAYGLDKTANQRMQEAAAIRKNVQQLQHLFQNDPEKFFEVTGVNRDEWLKRALGSRKEIAEEILAAEYERQQMSPEARRALELEEQVKRYQSRELEGKKPLIQKIREIVPENMLPQGLENASAEQLQEYLASKQAEFNQGLDQLSNELLSAWQEQGLPRVKEFGQWMAQVMAEHYKKTGQSLQPAEAAGKVKARFLNSTRSMLSQMDAKAIQETLGEEIVQKLRAYDVERVTQAGPQFGARQNDQAVPAVNEPKKQLNQQEWRKAMGIG